MAIEVKYSPDEFGWFKVSRRLIGSSRWASSKHSTIKLMIYMLERASHPMNPYPGDVREVGQQLAWGAGLDISDYGEAISELLAADKESQSGKGNGAFLEELTCEGRVVGYRVLNFTEYNPGIVERGAVRLAEKRKERARHAANSRWNRTRIEKGNGES